MPEACYEAKGLFLQGLFRMKASKLIPLMARCLEAGIGETTAPIKTVCMAFEELKQKDDDEITDRERELLFDVALVIARNDYNGQRAEAAAKIEELLTVHGVEKLKPQEVARTAERRAAAKA